MSKYYVYLVRCRDDSFYCGYTNDIERRIKVHNSGKGAKYTAGRLPVELAYYEEFSTRSDAMRRECEIKKLTRIQKTELVNTFALGKEHTNE